MISCGWLCISKSGEERDGGSRTRKRTLSTAFCGRCCWNFRQCHFRHHWVLVFAWTQEDSYGYRWVPLDPVENLIEGEPPLFQFTMTKRNGLETSGISSGVYVIRKGTDKIGAFSNVCTHLSCLYTWRDDTTTSYARAG